jgi:hypothetical protein
MRIHHIVVYGLSGFTTFFHIHIDGTILEKKMFIEQKMCIVIYSTLFVRDISHFKKKRERFLTLRREGDTLINFT